MSTRVITYTGGEQDGRSKTILGFMVLNGYDIAMVSEKTRREDVNDFLGLMRLENEEILGLLKNASKDLNEKLASGLSRLALFELGTF
ncbi:hypothetical protein KEJ36_02670 [Candidatus Bathyarchaeota archaeon]|nr:hypothetical protein [Candidatus Bathyarchaeota archaeon]MBS7627711.1 hypothetical protein [Candidatus Bathyarchaeota archaeon]